MQMDTIVNRKAKDSVFIDVFAQPENQLKMLHVFHPDMTDVAAEDIMIMLFDQEYATEAYVRSQKEEARKEGRKEGRAEGALSTLHALVKNGMLKKEDAAAQAGLTVAEFEEESCRLSSL